MKNFTLSLSILFLFTNCLYSQDTIIWIPEKSIANAEYAKHYEKLKRLFVQHLESESYVNYKKLQDAFAAKINVNSSPEGNKLILEAQNMDEIMKWVVENIEETSFKDYVRLKLNAGYSTRLLYPVLKENLKGILLFWSAIIKA